MINRHVITEEQALDAIENGEFDNAVLQYENVIIIMTQDWCPQWSNMKCWMFDVETEGTFHIFELVYNRAVCFQHFMRFKESIFGNCEVPYVRYYKNGKLIKETNYVNIQRFKNILDEMNKT